MITVVFSSCDNVALSAQPYLCIWAVNKPALVFYLFYTQFCVALYHLLKGLSCICGEITWDQNMNKQSYLYFLLAVVIHPRPNFNGGFVNPRL